MPTHVCQSYRELTPIAGGGRALILMSEWKAELPDYFYDDPAGSRRMAGLRDVFHALPHGHHG